ncbi:Neutral/alkaline non-lysosomal ceramidase-domain-containing protein [Zopfochytrium polystomum]|nr:Neutral/alkaline non-lysosomal ceramidase-domain-containing protein [Zopfochytrium polystomum]
MDSITDSSRWKEESAAHRPVSSNDSNHGGEKHHFLSADPNPINHHSNIPSHGRPTRQIPVVMRALILLVLISLMLIYTAMSLLPALDEASSSHEETTSSVSAAGVAPQQVLSTANPPSPSHFDQDNLGSPSHWRVSKSDLSVPIVAGVGKADATPFIGNIPMLGYGEPGMTADGIHLRTYARAFVFANPDSPASRVVFVSIDIGFVSAKTRILAAEYLVKKLPQGEKHLYGIENIMVSATHTHAAPGGMEDYFLYQIPSFGVLPGQRERVASAIADSIVEAHHDLQKRTQGGVQDGENVTGNVVKGKRQVSGAGVNRSLKAYLANPEEERLAHEPDGGSVDRQMLLLAILDSQLSTERNTEPKHERLAGILNWFAVHGTSMNKTTHLVSGDNKGYASYLWELEKGGVAAFAQTNAGDVSPNLLGGVCKSSGVPCDGSKTCCGGNPIECIARGPGYEAKLDDTVATQIIGARQFHAAAAIVDEVLNSTKTASAPISGRIHFRHAYIDMSDFTFPDPENPSGDTTVTTCPPTLGYSFAAGTTDGYGAGVFHQGDNSTAGSVSWFVKPILAVIKRILGPPPGEAVRKCQSPKPVLLGGWRNPYAWLPRVVPVQLYVVGTELVIVGVPGEVTTMAGRRLRRAVRSTLVSQKVIRDNSNVDIVIAGLANEYASYITTRHEYSVQRYEGASTLFGKYTLEAYTEAFRRLIVDPPAKPTDHLSMFPFSFQEDGRDNSAGALIVAEDLDDAEGRRRARVRWLSAARDGIKQQSQRALSVVVAASSVARSDNAAGRVAKPPHAVPHGKDISLYAPAIADETAAALWRPSWWLWSLSSSGARPAHKVFGSPIPGGELAVRETTFVEVLPLTRGNNNADSKQPPLTLRPGRRLTATVSCAHPRRGGAHLSDGTEAFLTVERWTPDVERHKDSAAATDGDGQWTLFLTDADWDTTFLWKGGRTCALTWDVGRTKPTAPGHYRLLVGGVAHSHASSQQEYWQVVGEAEVSSGGVPEL